MRFGFRGRSQEEAGRLVERARADADAQTGRRPRPTATAFWRVALPCADEADRHRRKAFAQRRACKAGRRPSKTRPSWIETLAERRRAKILADRRVDPRSDD